MVGALTPFAQALNKLRKHPLSLVLLLILFVLQGGNALFAQTEYRLFGTSTFSGGSIFSLNSTGADLVTHKVFSANGNGPVGSLLQSDGYLYGMTSGGGSFNAGTIFSVKIDGTGFQLIHEFNSIDGSQPENGLILAADGMLYGLTSRGGSFNNGVAFRINKNGTGFEKIYDFLSARGKTPVGKLMQASNNDFYGMTSEGGATQAGTIFKIDHTSFNYTVLHTFDGDVNGGSPQGGLTEGIDNKLYGMTFSGGTPGKGVIFQIDLSGGNFNVVHEFSGTDGAAPSGDLVHNAGEFYGMTSQGGAANNGVVFRMSGDGANFEVMKDFDTSTGISPDGSLIIANDFLYGATKGGSAPFPAKLFRLSTDGLTYEELFTISDNSRFDVTGSLVMDDDGDLYGVKAPSGDLHQDVGTVYKLDMQTLQMSTVHLFQLLQGSIPVSRMVQGSDLRLYGTTVGGGANGMGAIYSISSAGNDYQLVHSFTEAEGKFAYGGLTPLAGGFFAGTTAFGGAFLNGSIYKIKFDGTGFTKLHDFQSSEGSGLLGGVALGNDGKLYGLANGGPSGFGTVFRMSQDGSNFETLHQLTGADGSTPRGGLIKASNGSFYGVTSAGGAHDLGVIFKVSSTGVYTKLFDFDGANGEVPYGDLIEASNNKLYGMTSGSAAGAGVIYRIDLDGSNFTIVREFSTNEGGHPLGALTQAPTGEFYAMATAEGQFGTGYIFRINLDGSGFLKLADLDFINGNPESSLAVVPLTIQTIDFTAIPVKTMGDPDFTLTATATSGLPITFTSLDTSVATVDGNIVTIVGGGTTTIVAYQKGNVFYSTATATRQLVVNKNDQTITFDALGPKMYGDVPFALTATASSGLVVTYTIDDETVATISGNTVTIKGTGTAMITAKQVGSSGYNAASPVTQQLTINKSSQTITFTASPAKTLGDVPFDLTATASSGLAVSYSTTSDKISIASGKVTMSKAGRTSIVANQAGNSNYDAAPAVERSFCINPKKPVIGQTETATSVTLSSNNDAGNQWYLNGSLINGATSVNFTPTQTGRYTVQTTVDDCLSAMSAFVDISFTGLEDPIMNKISVYPNPARDEVYVEISGGSSNASVMLIDMTGRVIEQRALQINVSERFNTSQLPKGLFVFRIQNGHRSTTHSFVRE
jgi:uncharacterized repeat protein (TIGR03803 family)